MVDHTALAPSLVISHEISEDSPLHGLTMEDIRAADGAIFVSVAATDDNHLQVGSCPMLPARQSSGCFSTVGVCFRCTSDMVQCPSGVLQVS